MTAETDPRVERTRAAIREALVSLVEEEGMAGLTHQRVAERAHLGRATIYRHLPTPEDLVHEAFDCMDASLPTPDDDTFEAQLLAIGRKVARDLNDPAARGLMVGMMQRAQCDPDASARQSQMVGTMLEQLRAVAGDAAVDVDLAVAQVIGAVLFRALFVGEQVDDELVQEVVRRALVAPPV